MKARARSREETALGLSGGTRGEGGSRGRGGGAIGWAFDDAEGATRLADGSLDLSSPHASRCRNCRSARPTPPPRLWVARARARRSSR